VAQGKLEDPDNNRSTALSSVFHRLNGNGWDLSGGFGFAVNDLAFGCEGFISTVRIGQVTDPVDAGFGVFAQIVLDILVQPSTSGLTNEQEWQEQEFHTNHLRS